MLLNNSYEKKWFIRSKAKKREAPRQHTKPKVKAVVCRQGCGLPSGLWFDVKPVVWRQASRIWETALRYLSSVSPNDVHWDSAMSKVTCSCLSWHNMYSWWHAHVYLGTGSWRLTKLGVAVLMTTMVRYYCCSDNTYPKESLGLALEIIRQ